MKHDSMICKYFLSQKKNITSKDWITTVISNLKEIDLDQDFEEIKQMKKGSFINQMKKKIECKILIYLEKRGADQK
jgi:hypothetical protein